MDMNAENVIPGGQLIEQLGVATNDEIDATEAALNIGVHAHHPCGARRTARSIPEAITEPIDERNHPGKSLPRFFADGRLVLVRLDVDTPDCGYGLSVVHRGVVVFVPRSYQAGDLLCPRYEYATPPCWTDRSAFTISIRLPPEPPDYVATASPTMAVNEDEI
jgi:hypothetical protein